MWMGGASVDGKDKPGIESVEEMVVRFTGELMAEVPQWKTRIRERPEDLEALEREVHVECARGADLVVAGLVSVTMKEAAFQQACDETRDSFAYPLSRGRERTIRVKLLGGLVMWVFCLYCQPRRRWFGKTDQEKKPGLYVEAAQFGFGKGVTPGLQSRVARQAALCPSFDFAHEELTRSGVELDIKTVRRISYQCGEGLLRLRRHHLEQWRRGKLPAGAELKGERVTVQIDGGRTKLRGKLKPAAPPKEKLDDDGLVIEDAPGRSKKRAKRTYSSEWKEPKLLTIFVHDEHGKMVKKSQATMDGTMLGPDAVAELVAMHLHRLGAAQAKSITFVADGAPWIWDRIPTIVKLTKLTHVELNEVLDNCHAAHHVSLALAALGLTDKERMPLYREHRTLLRNGQWRRVVEELQDLAATEPKDSAIHTEIAYLEKHGSAGRLSYRHFRTIGIPLGSGAIESTIRRVINQRLKGNGLSWYRENAEAMLQLRAQVVSKRWNDQLQAMRALARKDTRTDWNWEPRPMSVKDESNLTTSV